MLVCNINGRLCHFYWRIDEKVANLKHNKSTNNTDQQQFHPVNLTMDSSRVIYADYHAISIFYNTSEF